MRRTHHPRLGWAVLTLLTGACQSGGRDTQPVTPPPAAVRRACEAGTLSGRQGPSRDRFLRELLFPEGTALTPAFDDYTEGSYHIDKGEVAATLPDAARLCGVQLVGLVVIGPLGPLWTYQALAFLKEGDRIRVNSILMPHARITAKATVALPLRVVDEFFASLGRFSVIEPIGGLPSGSSSDRRLRDFGYDLAGVRFGDPTPQYWRGTLSRPADSLQARVLLERLDRLLDDATTTYVHIN